MLWGPMVRWDVREAGEVGRSRKVRDRSRPKSWRGPGELCRVQCPQTLVQNLVVNCLGVLWPSLRGQGGLGVRASVLSLSSHLSSLWKGNGTLAIRFHGCAQSQAGGSAIFLTLPRPGSLASYFSEIGREGHTQDQVHSSGRSSGLTTLGLNGGWISLFSSFSQSILLKKACSLTSRSPSGPQPSRLAGCLVISWRERDKKYS